MGESDRLVCNDQSQSEDSAEDSQAAGRGSRQQSTGFVGYVIIISLMVSIGGVIGGYSHGFPSPTLLNLQVAYERGERVTAFSSSSVYAGLFGVSPCMQKQPHPLPLICCPAGYRTSGWTVWGLLGWARFRFHWTLSGAGCDDNPSPDWLVSPSLRPMDAKCYWVHHCADGRTLVHWVWNRLGVTGYFSKSITAVVLAYQYCMSRFTWWRFLQPD